MEGDERVRFCGECRKNVYNLSAMSRAEAEALVSETEGRICVRFYQRRDGTVLTDNCPVGLRKARRWLSMQLAAISAVFAGLLALTPGASGARIKKASGNQRAHHSSVANRKPPRVNGKRIKKTGWYQRARPSSVANRKPPKLSGERIDPTPPEESVFMGVIGTPF